MVIRLYQDKDLKDLTKLMSDLGYPSTEEQMKERLKQIHNTPNQYTYVLEHEGAVISMIGIRLFHYYEGDGLAGQITAFVTKEAYQGKGYGTKILTFVENWLLSQGVNMIFLNSGIREERVKAHEFYKKHGYEQTGIKFSKRLG